MTLPHERYIGFLETLTPETLVHLGEYVSPDVHFKDPFNDVVGVDSMTEVFRHMFENIPEFRFHVRHAAMQGAHCMMEWQFQGVLMGRAWQFDGMSLVRFDGDGRVVSHVDHWDAGQAFYERLPVLGRVLSLLRRRISVD